MTYIQIFQLAQKLLGTCIDLLYKVIKEVSVVLLVELLTLKASGTDNIFMRRI